MLYCSSIFWKCVRTVPVVPFKLKGSDILWICYFFLLLIVGELYPQRKNSIKVYTKDERAPHPGSSSTFWIPCFLYTGQNFIFQGQETVPHKMCLIKIYWPHKKKTVKLIPNNFLFLLILIWSRSLQLQ